MGDTPGVHRYVSFHERLKHINIDLARESGTTWGAASGLQVSGLDAPASVFAEATGAADVSTVAEASDIHSTAFGTALEQWYELNLSLPFHTFHARVMPMAQSLVLLLHHRDEIAAELDTFLSDTQHWLAWDALLDLVPRMAFDLGPEFLHVYQRLLTAVLRASCTMHKNLTHGDDALAARIVERAFHSAAWIFRAVSSLMRTDAPDILLTSWSIVRGVLIDKQTTSHAWRFATEALSHLIRKAPISHLHALQARMIADADDASAEGIAATWANSCQSASHTLHSRTREMLSCVLVLDAQPVELVRRLGSWIITSLVHHAHAEDMDPVFDMLLCADASGDALHTQLVWITTAVGTRKGTRVSDDAEARLLGWLLHLDERLVWTADHVPLLEAYTALVSAALLRARVQDMTSHGKRLLDAFAQRPTRDHFAVPWSALHGLIRVLSDPAVAWRSFRAFGLPGALDATTRALEVDEASALALLVQLESQGHLAPLLEAPPTTVVLRWAKRMRHTVQRRIDALAEHLERTSLDTAGWECLLAVPLAYLFPAHIDTLATSLVRCIHAAKDADVLGILMASLVRCKATRAISDMLADTNTFVRLLQPNRAVLPAMADMVRMSQRQLDVSVVWPCLTDAIRDSDRVLVRAALDILASTVHDTTNVFKMLSDVEGMALEVQTIATRNTKLRQTQREACRVLARDDIQLEALVHYTVGTLRLNFRPVWAASRDTLVALCSAVPESVWRVSFAELRMTEALLQQGTLRVPASVESEAEEDVETTALASLTDAAWQQRWQWMQRHLCLTCTSPTTMAQDMLHARSAAPDVRLDVAHYASEILRLYAQHVSLPERHSAAFVPHVQAQWTSIVDADEAVMPTALRAERLRLILDVFGAFHHAARMHDAADMKARFLALCADPELVVQRAALDCLLTWRDAWLVAHTEKLHALLEPAKFRDTLAQLDLSASSEQWGSARPLTMQVILRLLYGMLVSRRGLRTSGAGQGARRTAILAALFECAPDELGLLADLMLTSFADRLPEPRKQLGFLGLLGDVLEHLGKPLAPSMPRFVHVVIAIAASAEPSDPTMRLLRRTALRRLADLVRYAHVDWAPFRTRILDDIVLPRLKTFAEDSVQSPSSLLDLCNAWASQHSTLLCFLSDERVLSGVYAGLSSASIKPAVAHTILDIAERIHDAASDDDEVRDVIVAPTAPALLTHLVPLVRHTVHASFAYELASRERDELLRKELSTMSYLAPHMTRADEAAAVLHLLVPLMEHSARAVQERVKTELLRTVTLLLPRAGHAGPDVDVLYALFARLGAELQSPPARAQYTLALSELANIDHGLKRVTTWVAQLNAYHKLHEPDMDTRLEAWDAILAPSPAIDAREWHALLYQALFFVMDTDELVLRTNAAALLQHFVKASVSVDTLPLVRDVFLPSVYRRLHTRAEPVRKELFNVLGVAVAELHTHLPPLAELHVLLAGDDEASVFTNLFHIQAHRRVRAMHRLADAASQLRSKTLSELLVPLVWHFLLPNASGGIDMNMANEALACIRRMASHLQWGHYYFWLKRFLRELQEHVAKDDTSATERLHVRGIVGVLEAFHFDCTQHVDHVDEDATPTQPDGPPAAVSLHLATTISTRVLPPLYEALHADENRLPPRLPLIVGAARLALHLPADRRPVELFKVFGELGRALRSKLQSTRDTCRAIALQMLQAIGATYLPDVVHELRRMLTRGPQLAVCAYTIHSLLVALSSGDAPPLTLLDRGVRDITEAVMEDLFGLTSEDRVTVEFRTKVRELRQSKSLDSFEHLARLADPASLQELLIPLRGVLATSIEPKVVHTAHECLHRIASGMSANPHLDAQAFLVLCYTLIARGEKALQSRVDQAPHLAQNAHLFVELGLDLLTTALRRSRFDMHDQDTVAKLVPLIRAVGETLYARHAPVVERGLRAAAALARCPLPTLDEALPVMQKQMLVLLRHAGGIHSAIAQTTLRALSVVIREGRAKAPPAQHLTELLHLVSSDLDAPESQGSIFALLRAIVSRAFVVPEIYDVMDRIAELLVTSHDAQVREVCRSLYLAFLLDYPQGHGRLKNQLEFLAKHLAYESEGGRRSVLELVGAILAKFSPEVVAQYAQLFFVALVMQLANEESTACRKQAADVLGTLLHVLPANERDGLLRMTRPWAMAQGTPQAQKLAAVALRVYDIAAASECPAWAAQDAATAVAHVLTHSAEAMDEDVVSWHLTYQALQTMQTLARDAHAWTSLAACIPHVLTLLTLPHAWCRIAACRVLGAYFAAGHTLDASEYVRAARQLVAQLYSAFLDDALVLQIVRNLVFLGKAFANGDADGVEDSDSDDVEDDVAPRLAWLYTKLSHTARLDDGHTRPASGPQRVGAVLKWFAAMATQLDASITTHFLVHILSPLQRVTDDEQAPDDLKTLASEVQDLIQAQVETTAFTRAYAHVKQTRLEKRRVRKHERLMEDVMDPERAAKRRASRNTAKHESRKRKHAHFRDIRQSGKRTKKTD